MKTNIRKILHLAKNSAVEWRLTDGEFAASGYHKNDYAGQCLDSLAIDFPENETLKRIIPIWERWHLNHMRAGSPNQEQWLRENKKPKEINLDHYTWATNALSLVGINPDENYIHNGKPYKYGSAWLKEELPEEIEKEILSW